MFYEAVFKKLNEENIDYLVVGGVALVLHGAVRLTADLDLMLLPEPKNLQKFVSAMKSLGYKAKLPALPDNISFELLKNWKKERNLQVLAFYETKENLKLVDVLIDPAVDYEEAIKDKKVIQTWGIQIPIISIDDLIKLKKEASRPQDLADIESLNNLTKVLGENEK